MDDLTPEARQNRAEIAYIRCRLVCGLLSYEQARAEAAPIIARMNAVGARIARESGVKYRPITFTGLMR